MAKIHGLVYILVGLFISIMSWRLNYEKLIFFFYAGWVLVLFGVVKLIFSLIKNKTGKKEGMQHKTSHHRIKYCRNCRNALSLQARFCTRCRARL